MIDIPATSGRGGKGGKYRPVNTKMFDRNFIRAFGATCPKCNGVGCSHCEAGKIYSPDHYYRLGGK